mmetsp:Transcript_43466/g.74182  ORF Transcript_43466/g.74182 Transcript_43466/m.74182 type:complete len:137 (-) Transcript_43466:282-692(-)
MPTSSCSKQSPEITCNLTGASISTTLNMETAAKEKPVQVSLKRIDADDLKSIKKDDPFLYYSIPEVRKAAMAGRDIDMSELGGILETMNDKDQTQSTVKRQTRISFECPLDVCLMDKLGLSDDEFEDSVTTFSLNV